MSDRVPSRRPALWQEAYELPKFASAFVGRDRELAELRAVLARGERFLTITGPAGIGKSRLAVELAHELANDREVAALLRLSPLRDAAQAPKLLASICALDGWPDLPIEHFPSELRGVLVLDGFDHIPDAGTSVASLRNRCPELVVIVTSRDILRLPGEYVLSLAPLGVEALSQLLRVRVDPSTDITFSIAELPVPLRGNPLATELTAGLLNSGYSLLAQTQASSEFGLSELIERSIATLEPHDLRLFERLCISAGGLESSMVTALGEVIPRVEGDLAGTITRLMGLHLLGQVSYGEATARFEIPTAVRQVGLNRLNASGELATVRMAHAMHLLDRAGAVGELMSGRRRDAAVAWFEREYAGLRQAFGVFVQTNRVRAARDLAVALLPYWLFRRRYREARRWLTVALELTQPPYAEDDELELLVALGLMELYLGNDAAARTRALSGARPGMPIPQKGWRGAALATLGLLAARDGDHARAIGLYRVYLEATQSLPESSNWAPQLRAITRLAMASAHHALGELDDAEYHATMALKRAMSLGYPLLVGYARINLGAISAARADIGDALEFYRDGISLLIEQPHSGAAGAGSLGLANIALLSGATDVAARLLDLAETLLAGGSPVPPFLISFDPDALQALLAGSAANAPSARDQPKPILRHSDAAAVVFESIDILAGVQAPVEVPTARKHRSDLTARELEALCLAAEDMTDLEIADALFISKRTASDHMRNVLGKLGVHSRTGAVARALREGWCS